MLHPEDETEVRALLKQIDDRLLADPEEGFMLDAEQRTHTATRELVALLRGLFEEEQA